MSRIKSAAVLEDVIRSVNLVMPGTSVPVIVAREVKNAGAFKVNRNIEIVRELVQVVACVGAFVSAAAIICAYHIGPGADSLIGPTIPHPVGVNAHRDNRRMFR